MWGERMSSLPLQAPTSLQKALRMIAKTVSATKSPVVFRQGEAPRGVFLVESGSVRLSLRGEGDDAIYERVMGRGSVLGLPATINNVPYSATATVVEDAELAFISREQLLALMMHEPPMAMAILKLLSQEIHSMRQVIARSHPRSGGRPAGRTSI